MTPEEARRRVIEFLSTELVGPTEEAEILQESPTQRYSAGVLFPSATELPPLETSDESPPADPGADPDFVTSPDDLPGSDRPSAVPAEAADDEEITLANSYLPSAMGLTGVVAGGTPRITVRVSAAVYIPTTTENAGKEWARRSLESEPIQIDLPSAARSVATEYPVVPARLVVRVRVRSRSSGDYRVTAALVNRSRRGSGKGPGADRCFFQCSVAMEGEGSPFREFSTGSDVERDPEAAELSLLYRKRVSFALGHGCAADWDAEGGRASSIRTSVIPTVKVPPVEPRSGTDQMLSMEVLAGLAIAPKGIPAVLEDLPSQYESWLQGLRAERESVPPHLLEAADRSLERCADTLARIRRGIEILANEPQVLEAFMLANKAMLMQQYHFARQTRSVGSDWNALPNAYSSFVRGRTVRGYWRVFQLAFILMNVASVHDPDDAERDLVDLIWFPTGGGKTEAYLGLTALVLFLRRLRNPADSGCVALMRYTLRLLTAQQFQRAAALICSIEMMRRGTPTTLGSDPITIGLWVGKSLTPNARAEAITAANRLARGRDREDNPFQLLTCPWCGTRLDEAKHLGYVPRRSDRADRKKTVEFVCPEERCDFHGDGAPLPVVVIDQDIYDAPPSLLIGTVDKFAMLAWRPEAGALFGLSGENSSPELIIQDELHLISGPLGSLVGLYEGTIDLLCSGVRRPKIVGSTATIRKAADQCWALYHREVRQFPPSGLDVSNSWFAVEKPAAPGRVYCGVLATASPSPVTALVRTAAALLQAGAEIPADDGDYAARDPYWTLVQYFGSLRELGRASTLVTADIPEYMHVMRRRASGSLQFRPVGFPAELTSRRTAAEIPEILERLERPLSDDREPGGRVVDTLLATNMISVGVDIDRLGLMLVVGQPKTTSEYIQASSRVGRSGAAPGLVVTLYNAGKPRDRSHYEWFRGYHESFYRHVEPTSVTPYAIPVLDRALHAQLVITARLLARAAQPTDVDEAEHQLQAAAKFLAARCADVDSDHVPYLRDLIEARLRQWRSLPPEVWGGFGDHPEERPLMYPAGVAPLEHWADRAWATPSSMRNVDAETLVEVTTLVAQED